MLLFFGLLIVFNLLHLKISNNILTELLFSNIKNIITFISSFFTIWIYVFARGQRVISSKLFNYARNLALAQEFFSFTLLP